MAGVHSLDERLVLPVETVGSAAAVQVVQRKEWLLVDGLAPFEVWLLYLIVVLRQHVVDLGI